MTKIRKVFKRKSSSKANIIDNTTDIDRRKVSFNPYVEEQNINEELESNTSKGVSLIEQGAQPKKGIFFNKYEHLLYQIEKNALKEAKQTINQNKDKVFTKATTKQKRRGKIPDFSI